MSTRRREFYRNTPFPRNVFHFRFFREQTHGSGRQVNVLDGTHRNPLATHDVQVMGGVNEGRFPFHSPGPGPG